MLAYIRGTVNATDLQVKAFLAEQVYEKGLKVTEDVFQSLNIQFHEVLPRWNYTIRP